MFSLKESRFQKSKKKVRLKNPDLNCFVEITSGKAYIYFEKFKGAGGMPVETSAKSIILLSGGIDSSLICVLASRFLGDNFPMYHGRFAEGPEYDESEYAREIISHTKG